MRWLRSSARQRDLNRGNAFLDAGEFEKARSCFNQVIATDPENAAAFCNRGICYQYENAQGLALADFQRASTLSRRNHRFAGFLPLIHWNRGISYKMLCKFDRAIDEFNASLALDANFAPAFEERGVAKIFKGDVIEAIADFNRVLAVAPAAYESIKFRGYAYFFAIDFSSSEADLRRVLQIKVEPHTILFLHLIALKTVGSAGAQVKELLSIIQHLPKENWPYPIVDFFIGSTSPDQLVQCAPSQAEEGEANFYIGQYWLSLGQEQKAIAAFQDAQEKCPHNFIESIGAKRELAEISLANE